MEQYTKDRKLTPPSNLDELLSEEYVISDSFNNLSLKFEVDDYALNRKMDEDGLKIFEDYVLKQMSSQIPPHYPKNKHFFTHGQIFPNKFRYNSKDLFREKCIVDNI